MRCASCLSACHFLYSNSAIIIWLIEQNQMIDTHTHKAWGHVIGWNRRLDGFCFVSSSLPDRKVEITFCVNNSFPFLYGLAFPFFFLFLSLKSTQKCCCVWIYFRYLDSPGRWGDRRCVFGRFFFAHRLVFRYFYFVSCLNCPSLFTQTKWQVDKAPVPIYSLEWHTRSRTPLVQLDW